MNTSYLVNSVGPYGLTNPPGIPPEVRQVAALLDRQVQQLLTEVTYYSVLIAGLMAVLSLVAGSLLLGLPRLRPGFGRFSIRLNWGAVMHPRVRRLPADTRVAAANRKALGTLSAQLRAGQFSN